MEVEHQRDRRRFMAAVDGGEAEIAYETPRDGVLDLRHTFVPRPARGQGVAERLIEHVVRHVRAEDEQIIATCPFVRGWIEDHPDARDVLAES